MPKSRETEPSTLQFQKKKEFQYIKLAYDLGVKLFGENYPQELRDKNIQKIEKNLNF